MRLTAWWLVCGFGCLCMWVMEGHALFSNRSPPSSLVDPSSAWNGRRERETFPEVKASSALQVELVVSERHRWRLLRNSSPNPGRRLWEIWWLQVWSLPPHHHIPLHPEPLCFVPWWSLTSLPPPILHLPWSQLWGLRTRWLGSRSTREELETWGVVHWPLSFWSCHHTVDLNAHSPLVLEIDQQDQCSPVMQPGPEMAGFSFSQTHTNLEWFCWVLFPQLCRGDQSWDQNLLSNFVFSSKRRSPPLWSHDRTWQTSLVSPAPASTVVPGIQLVPLYFSSKHFMIFLNTALTLLCSPNYSANMSARTISPSETHTLLLL